MPSKNIIQMRSLLLCVFITGFLYVSGEDSQQVASVKKCFQDKNINLKDQIAKANECSKHLPDDKDWNKKFCTAVSQDHLPCMEEISIETLKECLNPQQVDLLMKSLKSMFSKICEVTGNEG